MKKAALAAFVAFLAMVGPAVAQQGAEWISFKPGMLGPRLVTAGTMPDGLPVYVCIAPHGGGVHPGMTGIWTEKCVIGYGGREFAAMYFKVLAGRARWQAAGTGGLPPSPIAGAQEADGRPLYVCRARHEGAMLAGKYRPGFRGCNIGDGGREIAVTPFDILTY